jgi:hypothetical protein
MKSGQHALEQAAKERSASMARLHRARNQNRQRRELAIRSSIMSSGGDGREEAQVQVMLARFNTNKK